MYRQRKNSHEACRAAARAEHRAPGYLGDMAAYSPLSTARPRSPPVVYSGHGPGFAETGVTEYNSHTQAVYQAQAATWHLAAWQAKQTKSTRPACVDRACPCPLLVLVVASGTGVW